jgi:putative Mg2+ transporter-C (MgtC) family protein
MAKGGKMNLDFLNTWPVEINISARILLAFVLGGLIGWDREVDNQPAGIRTHILVSVGSASFTLVFIYGFGAGVSMGEIARSASQILTGIGFLGAGVIWRQHDHVRGITTAAGIWAISSVGMLCAVGMWFLAVFMTFLVFITLHYLKPISKVVGEQSKRQKQDNQADNPDRYAS